MLVSKENILSHFRDILASEISLEANGYFNRNVPPSKGLFSYLDFHSVHFLFRPCLVPKKVQKNFKIPCHIESYGACMEH